MAEFLPIYKEPPKAAVEQEQPKDRCKTCQECPLSGIPSEAKIKAAVKREVLKHLRSTGQKASKVLVAEAIEDHLANKPVKNLQARVRTVCMPPEGKPGGLLIVTDHPFDEDDKAGRPLIGPIGAYARNTISQHWKGPIAVDCAIKCAPKTAEIRDTYVKACRQYLAATLAEVKPTRIIAMGSWALYSLLGRRPPMLSVRRGFGWISNGMVPVFMVMSPGIAKRNPFMKRWYESDIEWACTVPVDKLIQKVPFDGFARIIVTAEDAEEAKQDLLTYEWFSWDVETAGKHYCDEFKVLTCGMAGKDSEDAWVWSKESLEDPACFAVFKDILSNPKALKVHQHGKYDTLSVHSAHKIDVQGVHGDTLYWRKMLDSDVDGKLEVMQELVGMGGGKEESSEAIQDVVKKCRAKYVGDPKNKQEMTELDLAEIGPLEHVKAIREGKGNPKTHAYALIPDSVLYRYVARDAISTARLGALLEPRLRRTEEVNNIWETLMLPAAVAVAQVEKWGVATSMERIHAFQTKLMMRQQELDAKFRAYGDEFNPGSSRHVADLLFNKLRLRPPKLTASGQPSTDAATLNILKGKHPVVEDILEYRLIAKQKGTYADGMEQHIRDDGRIHPSINLHGTRTGRLSCSDPNLQNITRASKDWFGKAARDLFVAPPGRVLVQLDFSQLELRVAAILSKDPAMKEIFLSGADYHQKTAEMISKIAWGINPDQVTSEHRSKAKCFHPDTEVLTKSGWKRIVDLAAGEEVMQALPSDAYCVKLEWAEPTEVFSLEHPSGQLVHMQNEGMDLRVTPDHRMAVWGSPNGKKPKFKVVMPNEVAKSRGWANAGLLADDRNVSANELRLLRLAVAIQADGHVRLDSGAITCGFSKQRKIVRLRALLGDAKYTETTNNEHGKKVHRFYIPAVTAQPILTQLDPDKTFPWKWLSLPQKAREAILVELSHWDGHARKNWRMNRYSSVVRKNADVIQAIAAITNRKSRLVTAPNGGHLPIHNLSIKDHNHSRGGNLQTSTIPFTDKVACLSVPSTFILVRDGVAQVPVITGQTVNFGLLYGMSDTGLASRIGATKEEAAKIRKGVLGGFDKYAQWNNDQVALARRTGYIWTWWAGKLARRRSLWRIADSDHLSVLKAEHGASNCLDAETEALTKRGWVKGFDLLMTDEILTKNPKTNALEWQYPTDLKFWPQYEGKLVEFKSRSFHAVSTPEHRWLVNRKTGGVAERTTASLSVYGDDRIHCTGDYSGPQNSILSDDEAELLGWFVTDGSLKKPKHDGQRVARNRTYSKPATRAFLCQSTTANPEKCARIDALLARLSCDPDTGKRLYKDGAQAVWRLGKRLSAMLYSIAPDRTLTFDILPKLSKSALIRLKEAMLLGDGWSSCSKVALCTGRKKQAEAFQMLCTLTGDRSSIVNRPMSMYKPVSPKLKNIPKMTSIWVVTILKRKTVQVLGEQRREYVNKEPVWCPMVPNTFFVARRSGSIFVTGNTPVQGTASDFCLASLVALVQWLLESKFPAKLVLTVHDSLIFEVDEAYVEELTDKAMSVMTSWPSEGVPILADAEIGLSWGSLVKFVKKNGVWLAKVSEKIDGKKVDKLVPWREAVFEEK